MSGDPPLEHPGSECCPVCRAEADRLRIEGLKQRDQARAERDRYREALREVNTREVDITTPMKTLEALDILREIARAALEGSEDEV